MYEDFRNISYDVPQVARSLDISVVHAQRIKDQLFIKEHLLVTGKMRFTSDYEIALGWQRCINGTPTQGDIQLFKHEICLKHFCHLKLIVCC